MIGGVAGRRVVIVAFPDVQSLDVVGPSEVFASAGGYRIEVVAPEAEPFVMSNGMEVIPHAALHDVRGAIDTLVIAGGAGTRHAARDERVIRWVRSAARQLVIFRRRPGGQSQFSSQLAALPAERAPLRELQAWIPANAGADLSVTALAERAAMSPRNFARAFRREIGMTPAAYVESVRVEQARIALEGSQAPVDTIAARCGFGTVETMR